MAESHVITALVAKRAELAGQLMELDRQRMALRFKLNHIDHALAIFGYGKPPRDIRAKRPVVNRKHRELAIFVRELHRDGVTLSNREAALSSSPPRVGTPATRILVRKIIESVKSARKQFRRSALSPA